MQFLALLLGKLDSVKGNFTDDSKKKEYFFTSVIVKLSLLMLAANSFLLNLLRVSTVTDCMTFFYQSEVVALVPFNLEAFNAKTG